VYNIKAQRETKKNIAKKDSTHSLQHLQTNFTHTHSNQNKRRTHTHMFRILPKASRQTQTQKRWIATVLQRPSKANDLHNGHTYTLKLHSLQQIQLQRRSLSTTTNANVSRNDTSLDNNTKPYKSQWRRNVKLHPPPPQQHKRSSSPKHNNNNRHPPLPPPPQNNNNKLPTTDWIMVTNIPMLSNLYDILSTMSQVVQIELHRGIVDLDAAEETLQKQLLLLEHEQQQETHGKVDSSSSSSSSTTLPLWIPNKDDDDDDDDDSDKKNQYPSHLVLEARLFLSRAARPSGWFLRFPNKSVVHAILSHAQEGLDAHNNNNPSSSSLEDVDATTTSVTTTQPIICGGKLLQLQPFTPQQQQQSSSSRNYFQNVSFEKYQKYQYNDTCVRIENCTVRTTIEDVYFFLKEYDLIPQQSLSSSSSNNNNNEEEEEENVVVSGVEIWDHAGGTTTNRTKIKRYNKQAPPIFIVRFTSPSEARAAVREMQYKELKGNKIRMMQYPRQML